MKTSSASRKSNRQLIEKTRKKTFKNEARLRSTPHLELFQREDCPFSHAVRSRLSAMGVDYIVHNVTNPLAMKNAKISFVEGKTGEIPFLVDRKTGVKLHGGRPIIAYLEKEYGLPKTTRLGTWLEKLSSQIRERADEIAWAVRTPRDRIRLLADDMTSGWKSVRNSYRTVRKVVRESASQPPSRGQETRRKAA